jgi:predicted Zn-dependent peptidase
MLHALLIAMTVGAPSQGGDDALLPDSILQLPEGPRIVLFRNPGASVTAIRLSITLEEDVHEAGAARILQAQALQRVRSASASVGATVTASRTPWGISYTVVGPQTHFEYMAWILRQAVAAPSLQRVQFLRAREAVTAEVERTTETPLGVLAERLWSQISPGDPLPSGNHASMRQITPASVRALWERTHRPDRMTVVVAGPVSPDPIIVAFKDLTEAVTPGEEGAVDARALPTEERGRTQVLRRWYGQAYAAGDPGDPHAEVVALLAAERLRQGGEGYEAGVELWELGRLRVLAVTGAAHGRNASTMQTRIRGLVAETRAALTPDAARAAAAELHFQILSSARTPDGLVNLVGRHLDATGDPGAAGSYLDRIDAVTPNSLDQALAAMEAAGPVTAEVRP